LTELEKKKALAKEIHEYFDDYKKECSNRFLKAWGLELVRFKLSHVRVAFSMARAKSPRFMLSAGDIAVIASDIATAEYERKKRKERERATSLKDLAKKTTGARSEKVNRECRISFLKGVMKITDIDNLQTANDKLFRVLGHSFGKISEAEFREAL